MEKYQNICAKENCKFIDIVPTNTSHIKIKFIAQCGHENESFLTNFVSKKSGILCKKCKDKEISLKQKENNKNLVDAFDIEFYGFNYLRNLINNFYDIERTNDGCKVDIIIKPKEINENKWMQIQLKICSKPSAGLYYFHDINKDYEDCLILCLCLENNKIWLFNHNEIKHLKNLNIGIQKSKYDKNISLNLKDDLLKYYNTYNLFTKEQSLIPRHISSKLEHQYRLKRHNELSFLKYEYSDIDNTIFDFVINGYKIQEKVISQRKDRINEQFIIQIKRPGSLISYEKGDNDFYWIWLNNKDVFYIFPEEILIKNNLINNKIKSLTFSNKNNWTNNYKYDLKSYDDCKERLINLFKIKGLFSLEKFHKNKIKKIKEYYQNVNYIDTIQYIKSLYY